MSILGDGWSLLEIGRQVKAGSSLSRYHTVNLSRVALSYHHPLYVRTGHVSSEAKRFSLEGMYSVMTLWVGSASLS